MRRTGVTRYSTALTLAGLVVAGAGFIWYDRLHATTDELEARRQNVFRAFHRERVDRIEVEHTSGHFELVHERDAWFVVSNGRRRPADLIEAERLLSEIEGAESQRALGDLDGPSRQRFGLDRPRARVVVHEGAEVTARFSLGGSVDQEDAVYVEASALTGSGDATARALVLPKSFGQPFDRAAVEFRDRRIAEIDVDRLARVEFTVDGERRVLEHTGPIWSMTTPAIGRASRSAVEAVTSEMRDLRATRVLADDADAATLARHGLDHPSLRIEIRRASGAEPVVMLVGRGCPGHDDEFTAVREGTGTVVCVGRSFSEGFRAPPEGFRDDHLLAARTDEVSEVRVKGAGTAGADLVIRREGSAWRADNSPYTVDAEAVESWLTLLHDLSTHARLDGDQRATHGLAPALLTIEVKRTGVEGAERILVGSSDAQGLYAARDDETAVMQLAPSAAETLRVEPIRFRARAVLEETDDQLRAMVIDAGTLHEELARLDGVMRLTRPIELAADPALTSDLVHGVATLTADRWVSSTARPEFGLAQPRARVVARFEGPLASADGGADGGAPVRSYTLAFGASAAGGGVYATLEGQGGVFVVPRALYEQASNPHVDRGALRIVREAVTRFTIATGGASPARVTLVRSGDDWRTEAGATADTGRVDALLNRLASATAVRVFGYGPPPPEARFATPTMTLEFSGAGDAGQQSLRVVVGDRFGSGEGAGFYARRDGVDATLSLPEDLVETLQQYRP